MKQFQVFWLFSMLFLLMLSPISESASKGGKHYFGSFVAVPEYKKQARTNPCCSCCCTCIYPTTQTDACAVVMRWHCLLWKPCCHTPVNNLCSIFQSLFFRSALLRVVRHVADSTLCTLFVSDIVFLPPLPPLQAYFSWAKWRSYVRPYATLPRGRSLNRLRAPVMVHFTNSCHSTHCVCRRRYNTEQRVSNYLLLNIWSINRRKWMLVR